MWNLAGEYTGINYVFGSFRNKILNENAKQTK